MTETWRYAGEFNKLANTAARKKGSIHDDDAARGLGFRKAFVPGSVVGHYAMPAILDRYGPEWIESGWYDFNFVSPVYIDEDVRAVAAESDEGIAIRVETRDGRLCAHGRAGSGADVPWDTRGELAEVFPHARIGTSFSKRTEINPEDAAALLDASCDDGTGWRDIVPPEHLMPIALHMIDFKQTPVEGVRHPGMWAQHAIAVNAPIHWGRSYIFEENLAEKGISGRTQYLSFEFRVLDDEMNEVAVGRHKCKFLRKSDD